MFPTRLAAFKHPSWDHRVTTSIGHRLRIKFGLNAFSIGVSSIKKRYNLFPNDIIGFIRKDFSQDHIDKLIDSYHKTMHIDFVKANFNKWKDIKHNGAFISALDSFLQKQKTLFATAIASKHLRHSRDIALYKAYIKHQNEIPTLRKRIEIQNSIITKHQETVLRQNRVNEYLRQELYRMRQTNRRLKEQQKNQPKHLKPRKHYHDLLHPNKAAKYRSQKIIENNFDIITSSAYIFMKVLSKYCSEYEEELLRKYAEITNKEIAALRKESTASHSIRVYNHKVSERAHSHIRIGVTYDPNSKDAAKRKQKVQTSFGVKPDIIPSNHAMRNWREEYVQSLVDQDICFYPILDDLSIDWEYYEKRMQQYFVDKENINLSNNLNARHRKKLGKTIGATRKIIKKIKYTMHRFIFSKKFESTYRYHGSRLSKYGTQTIDLNLDIFGFWDETPIKGQSANGVTTFNIAYSGWMDGLSSVWRLTDMVSIMFKSDTSMEWCTGAMDWILLHNKENVNDKCITFEIQGQRVNFRLRFHYIADLKALFQYGGFSGIMSWCPSPLSLLYDRETLSIEWIDKETPTQQLLQIFDKGHVFEWDLDQTKANRILTSIDNVENYAQIIFEKFETLNSSNYVDYSNIPSNKASGEYKKWKTAHKARMKAAGRHGLCFPFPRPYKLELIISTTADILHFFIQKATKYIAMISTDMMSWKLKDDVITNVIDIFLKDANLRCSFGDQFEKAFADKKCDYHITGPILKKILFKINEIFVILEKDIDIRNNDHRLIKLLNIMSNVHRFKKIKASYDKLQHNNDQEIKEIAELHYQMFLEQLVLDRKNLIPYDWHGVLHILPSQVRKIRYSNDNCGLSECSTQAQEALQKELKLLIHYHSNNDDDEVIKIGNLSDLLRIDYILTQNISLEDVAKYNKKSYVYVFDEEQQTSFETVINGMSLKSQKIIKEMLHHDWRKGYPPYILSLYNRTREPPRKKRRRK